MRPGPSDGPAAEGLQWPQKAALDPAAASCRRGRRSSCLTSGRSAAVVEAAARPEAAVVVAVGKEGVVVPVVAAVVGKGEGVAAVGGVVGMVAVVDVDVAATTVAHVHEVGVA